MSKATNSGVRWTVAFASETMVRNVRTKISHIHSCMHCELLYYSVAQSTVAFSFDGESLAFAPLRNHFPKGSRIIPGQSVARRPVHAPLLEKPYRVSETRQRERALFG